MPSLYMHNTAGRVEEYHRQDGDLIPTMPDVIGSSTLNKPLMWGRRRPSFDEGMTLVACNNDYNGNVPRCINDLPEGFNWWGTYYAAFVDRARGNIHILTETAHNCPHCAFEEANRILLAGSGAELHRCRPAFVLCDIAFLEDTVWTNHILGPGETFVWPVSAQARNTNATTKMENNLGTACGHCGFPGHNRRTCWMGALEKCHDKVGIEIEGRYYNLDSYRQLMRQRPGMTDSDDGSISRGGRGTTREFRTTPGPVATALSQLLEFYPDESDRSCGLHVHVSFNCVTHITQLAHPKFFEYFKTQFQAWGEQAGLGPRHQFWARLNGQNSYCRPNVEVSDPCCDDRYRQLNFTSYERHKTLECRMLPMFRNAAHAVSAVQKLIQIYENWLGTEYDAQVGPVVKEHNVALHADIKQNRELDLSRFLKPTVRTEKEITIVAVEPVKPGWRRIVLTPEINGAALVRRLREAA